MLDIFSYAAHTLANTLWSERAFKLTIKRQEIDGNTGTTFIEDLQMYINGVLQWPDALDIPKNAKSKSLRSIFSFRRRRKKKKKKKKNKKKKKEKNKKRKKKKKGRKKKKRSINRRYK